MALITVKNELARAVYAAQKPSTRGRPRSTSIAEIIDKIVYVCRTGCQWRSIDGHDGIPCKTVYHWFRIWSHEKRAMEGAPPPEPLALRPRKRCPHDYASKYGCPVCSPCPGGHGKPKHNCGVCTGAVLEQDDALLTDYQRRLPAPPAPRGQKCGHTYCDANGKPHSYANKGNCPVCSNCGHNTTKKNCSICNGCPHGKLKQNCKVCDPCPHGLSKPNCRLHTKLELPIVFPK